MPEAADALQRKIRETEQELSIAINGKPVDGLNSAERARLDVAMRVVRDGIQAEKLSAEELERRIDMQRKGW